MDKQGKLLIVLVLLIGIGLSMASGWVLRWRESQSIARQIELIVADIGHSLQHEIDLGLELLQSLKSLHDATGAMGREQFHVVASQATRRYASIHAVEWVPRVVAADRAAYEESRGAITEGIEAQDRLVPASSREAYFPIQFVEPIDGNEGALGFDVASDARRGESLRAAVDTGMARASEPLDGVHEAPDAPALVVFQPVFRGAPSTPDERRASIVGLVIGVYVIDDVIGAARAGRDEIEVTIADHAGTNDVRVIHGAERADGPTGEGAFESRQTVDVAGRRWTVVGSPSPDYLASQRSWLAHVVLAIGLLFTAFLAVCVGKSARRAREVAHTVDDRTDELRAANQRLDRQRNILQSVLDNLGDGVAVADEQGRLLLFNPAAKEILGLDLVESGPENWSEFYGLYDPITEAPISVDELPLARAVAGERPRDVEMLVRNRQRPGGVFIRVTATPLEDSDGTLRGGVAVFRDISERKWAEAVLRDSEARFRAIVEATASALIILSPDYRIREFNPEAERIFGLGRADALGRNFLELCLPDEFRGPVEEDLRTVLGGGATPGFEIPVVSRDGGERTVLWSFSRLAGSGTLEAVVIATGHDITQRREAEKARRVYELTAHLESAREAERRSVAREIHDELGQALTGMKLEISFLSRRVGKAGTDIRERLDDVGRLIDRTIGWVRRIAADLRPQILDELGLVEAIRWHAEEFSRRTQIPCTVEVPDEPIVLSHDRATALYRIVQEAMTNIARHSQAKQASVRVTYDDTRILVEVRDDGRGIPDTRAVDPRSFGLIGMEERARMFKGTVTIRSGPDRGTTVRVSLPR